MKTALKNESEDVIFSTAPTLFCLGKFSGLDSVACSVRCPQRIGLCEGLRRDSARYNGKFFESGNQESRN